MQTSAINESKTYKSGQWNSSITRVRPFFQSLLHRDSSGKGWLPSLLSQFSSVPSSIATNPGELLPWVSENRSYKDKVLQRKPYNIHSIQLERCLEYSLQPPKAFLRWLVEHGSTITWEKKRKTASPETLAWRDKLFGLRGEEARKQAIEKAYSLLEQHGSQGSEKKWWAFEGFTEVDCYLETDRLILLIEGKRTEPLSASTDWYTGRNQIIRNLEAIAEANGGKEFGVIVLLEKPIVLPTDKEIADSLPHMESDARRSLMEHFWGCATWRSACESTGMDFNMLPDTSIDAVKAFS